MAILIGLSSIGNLLIDGGMSQILDQVIELIPLEVIHLLETLEIGID